MSFHFSWTEDVDFGKPTNVYPGGMFATHVDQFKAVVEGANPASVMPVFSILEGQSWEGTPIEQVGSAMSMVALTNILQDYIGFDGLVFTDWGAVGTGPFVPGGDFGLGSAWGTESLTNAERVALAVEAGVQLRDGRADDRKHGPRDEVPVLGEPEREHRLEGRDPLAPVGIRDVAFVERIVVLDHQVPNARDWIAELSRQPAARAKVS